MKKVIIPVMVATIINGMLFVLMERMTNNAMQQVIAQTSPAIQLRNVPEPPPLPKEELEPDVKPNVAQPQQPKYMVESPLLSLNASVAPALSVDITRSVSASIGTIGQRGLSGSRSMAQVQRTNPTLRVPPMYPPQARAKGIEGHVTVEFVILDNGKTSDARIVSSQPPEVFDRSALNAVRQWRYPEGTRTRRARIRLDFNF